MKKLHFFSSFSVNERHSSLKEKKQTKSGSSLKFHLCVHNDFCSSNAKEVWPVSTVGSAGSVFIARWSFILKTLRDTHGRWALIRLCPAASDCQMCLPRSSTRAFC